MYTITVRIKKQLVVRKSDTFTIGGGLLCFTDTNNRQNFYELDKLDFLSIAKE